MLRSVLALVSVMALAACGGAATESDNPEGDPVAAPSSEAVAAAPPATVGGA